MHNQAIRANQPEEPPDAFIAAESRPPGGAPTLALVAEPPRWVATGITEKMAAFLAEEPETPCLVVDLDVVEGNYRALRGALPQAEVYYAVKSNPAPPLVARLIALGSSFDTASLPEIDLCLGLGADPAKLSFGNTIKKSKDIAAAYERGVRLFAFDAEEELEKLAEHAPGSQVFCRLFVDNVGAEWPLSRKFGCSVAMAGDLLIKAQALGLEAHGVSFHVGSQQKDLGQWDVALEKAAELFRDLAAVGITLKMVNLGGGLPTSYGNRLPYGVDEYGAHVLGAVDRLFDGPRPRLIVEPGRYMGGNAGVLETEVVLVSRKDAADDRRWVYIDAGRFNGLAETEGEAIRYPIISDKDDGETGPVIIAGPTCDSVDILYDKAGYTLPLSLKAGDRLRLLSTGAYTTSYASVGFNGFLPLKAHYL
ncbi:ornithine decarboxylase [Rhodospirillum rubrum ATCC 11170]|uniref:ornithine decarboxylase n=1 Tax=Rhodospirillum rubrum (strain ATCC 11170 / ATH 1.1.1 / DSM 467 / LMG 4362 / NCIMB 8255 / S1) TaxID=269796 RepID=Q2RTQ2_RHORT|nr:type III PLP-dependent enzyme [Rhodospirillum rubrum]ABC22493.1 ornithine decarboxylase [Rhodospirillum rubrum ATCC 11170]MBK5954081.1 ornithine decarboxylase [Rhodospirillum rubrum]HAP99522.1 type III PLP-dependent enzyme [Rhodospirillum rubrum]HCF19263.1 type III PLP-dependent enzyme [Rhodospirillum rubrum]